MWGGFQLVRNVCFACVLFSEIDDLAEGVVCQTRALLIGRGLEVGGHQTLSDQHCLSGVGCVRGWSFQCEWVECEVVNLDFFTVTAFARNTFCAAELRMPRRSVFVSVVVNVHRIYVLRINCCCSFPSPWLAGRFWCYNIPHK